MSLILDTSAWLLGLAGEDPFASILNNEDELIVPGLVVAELDHHLRRDRRRMHRVLEDIHAGAYEYEPPTKGDLARARHIDAKFSNLALGLVDSSIVALAERKRVTRLLTTDGDFLAVRFGTGWRTTFELPVVPEKRSR